MHNTVNMLLVFTALSVKITVQEDHKMDAASSSKTLTTNYQPHGVTSQKTLIFNVVTLEDSKYFPTSVLQFLYTPTVWFFS